MRPAACPYCHSFDVWVCRRAPTNTAYSLVQCRTCKRSWETRANYVQDIDDA